ncbi:nitroreductase family protein [Cobetia sp. L2A1]|uniref:nitroreductase family protein n=1 Tax=Cobetia sp. L2A1 TaxID=2686360 RepID=UPI00131A9490|nr:nitroreductase family protein [Cobetia sp. L2A1]
MDALTLLHERNSMGKLMAPAPNAEQMEALYQAALRAPDHAVLTPWRFIEFTGAGLERLGELFAEAERNKSPAGDEAAQAAARKKPLRAPMVVAVIARVTPDHPKVPRVEQVVSAGCAAHAILFAVQALGLGGMWRTGGYAFDATVHAGLGMGEHDELVGFLYLGTPGGRLKPLAARDSADFVERWQ